MDGSNGICFFIAPIGAEGSETRKRSDTVLKHIVGPVARELGFEALRADHISEPGLITHQVIQHLVADPIVVADLTEHNANVFYDPPRARTRPAPSARRRSCDWRWCRDRS